jgi:hypothetical protein
MPNVSPGDRARPHTHTQSHTQNPSVFGSPVRGVAHASAPAHEAQNETDPKRCEQCGREGVRGFRVIPAVFVDWLTGRGVEPFWNPSITVCASDKACWRRREATRPRYDTDG